MVVKWNEVVNLKKTLMLIGEYKHTVDPKKRVSLPAKFRKEMGREVVITYGLDKCLFVQTKKEWEKFSGQLADANPLTSDKRMFNRFMLGGAMEVDVDALGRILIPDNLKEFAKLKERVAIIGVRSRLEIWDEDAWNSYKAEVEQKADVLAEKLGEVGFI